MECVCSSVKKNIENIICMALFVREDKSRSALSFWKTLRKSNNKCYFDIKTRTDTSVGYMDPQGIFHFVLICHNQCRIITSLKCTLVIVLIYNVRHYTFVFCTLLTTSQVGALFPHAIQTFLS